MEVGPQPLTLRNLLDVFRRHIFGMSMILMISLLVGAVLVLTSPAVYRSRTAILVDVITQANQNTNDPVTDVTLPNQVTDLVTQSAVLQSSRILFDVFRTADIVIPEGLTPEQLDRILPSVKVEPVTGTSIIEISVDTRSRDLCYRVAQIIPEVYLSYLRSSRQAEVDKALEFLTQRLTDQTADLKKAEQALNEFKKTRSLLPLENEGQTRSVLVSESRTRLAQAEAEVAGAQERLDNYLKELESIPESRRIATKQANMEMLEAQRALISQLQAKRDELLELYLPDRPEVKQVDAQIVVARKRLEEIPKEADRSTDTRPQSYFELEQAIATARSELKAAQARAKEVRSWAEEIESELKAYNIIVTRQQELERDVEDSKASLLSITRAHEELRLRRNSAREPVTIVQQATNPSQVAPKALQTMVVAAIMGFFMAVGFSLLKDRMDGRVLHVGEVDLLTNAPALAELPSSSLALNRRSSESQVRSIIERYRILAFNLRHKTHEDLKSLVITSPRESDGAAVVAENLALVLSESSKVLLVDCDIRPTSIKRLHNLEEQPGLLEVAAGTSRLDECIRTTSYPNLSVLTAGMTNGRRPVGQFSADHLATLVRDLEGHADIVIYHAPGCLDNADARSLAGVAGPVLNVLHLQRTSREALAATSHALEVAGMQILGHVVIVKRA